MNMAAQEVGSFLETLLPDESQRRTVFSAMADSIIQTNQVDPALWGVTVRLDRNCIRLNVGPIEVFVIARNEPVRVLVDSGNLAGRLPDGAVVNPAGEYESVKAAQPILVAAIRFAAIWSTLQKAHFSLLRLACERNIVQVLDQLDLALPTDKRKPLVPSAIHQARARLGVLPMM